MFAEEMGFIGAAAAADALPSSRLRFIAYRAPQPQPVRAAARRSASATNFFLYVFINMAMVTGLVPVVGVPLPLISYGGTSMLTMMVGFGFVMNAHVNRETRIRREELGPFW